MTAPLDLIMGAAKTSAGLQGVMEHAQGYHPLVVQVAQLISDQMADGVPPEEAHANGVAVLRDSLTSQPQAAPPAPEGLGALAAQGGPPAPGPQAGPSLAAPPGPQAPAAGPGLGAASGAPSLGELAATARGGLGAFLQDGGLGGAQGRVGLGPPPQVSPAPAASQAPAPAPAPRAPSAPSTFSMTPRSSDLRTFNAKDLEALNALQPMLTLMGRKDIEKAKLEAKARSDEAMRELKASMTNARISSKFEIEAARMDAAEKRHATDIMLALERIRAQAENARLQAATRLQAASTKAGTSVEVESKKEAGRNARAQLAADMAAKRTALASSLGALKNLVTLNPALTRMRSFEDQVTVVEEAVRALSDAGQQIEMESDVQFPAPIGTEDIYTPKGQPEAVPATTPAAPAAKPPAAKPASPAPAAGASKPGASAKAPPGNPPDPARFKQLGGKWFEKQASGTWILWKG